jgi:DNA-binding transcriptional LysR family regulator
LSLSKALIWSVPFIAPVLIVSGAKFGWLSTLKYSPRSWSFQRSVMEKYLEAEDSEAIKGLVESGFGYSILPEHALRRRNRFFQTYRVAGHRITRSLALGMARNDYPRKLTESVAEFLQKMLSSQQ